MNDLIPVDQIEPNQYNPNVLKGEKYEALKADVKAGDYDYVFLPEEKDK